MTSVEICKFCEFPVDPDDKTLGELVDGWVLRRFTGQGGINAIRMKSKPKAFAHRLCLERAVDAAKRKISLDQAELF